MTHAEKEVRNQKIVALRHEGQSMNQIAELTGLSTAAVLKICKRYGVNGVMSSRRAHPSVYKNQYTSGFDREANAAKYVNACAGFEYVGGFTGIDGFVDIRCKKCGTVQKKSMVTIRHKRNLICPICTKAEREQREEEQKQIRTERKEKAKEERKRRTRERRFWGQGFRQESLATCPVCNNLFVKTKSTQIYCSERCGKNSKYQMKEGYRYQFPLEEVYERDNGICYLCGKPCDWEDYTVKDGVMSFGGDYPSRDHIIPKSRGGKNTWNNIRLAHRRCNTRKGISPYPKNGVATA